MRNAALRTRVCPLRCLLAAELISVRLCDTACRRNDRRLFPQGLACVGSLAALESIPSDCWVYTVMPSLAAAEILPLHAVSTQWRGFVMTDDVWLDKLTTLSLQYPSLLHLEQAIDESVFAWFWRCMCAVGNGVDLARRHARGEYPYLQLYGTVNNSMFTPHAVMRFPVELGVIA